MLITKIELISISEGTDMPDFRDQEAQEVFTKCDTNNIYITIICGVFFKNVDFPRPADSASSACDQAIFIFQKLTVSLFLHLKSDNCCNTKFRMLLDILVHLKGILRQSGALHIYPGI